MTTNSVAAEASIEVAARGEIVVDLSQVPDAPASWTALEGQADASDPGWFAVVADHAAAAVAAGDRDAMSGLLRLLREVDANLAGAGNTRDSAPRHATRAVTELLGALYDRLVAAHPAIRPNSEIGLVLIAMSRTPGGTNTQVADRAGLNASQVSRTGRRLQALGLAHAARFGRENAWQLTPRGRQVAKRLVAISESRSTSSPTVAVESASQSGYEPGLAPAEEAAAAYGAAKAQGKEPAAKKPAAKKPAEEAAAAYGAAKAQAKEPAAKKPAAKAAAKKPAAKAAARSARPRKTTAAKKVATKATAMRAS
jgi:DNA-binding MarR family transcriptional regulator